MPTLRSHLGAAVALIFAIGCADVTAPSPGFAAPAELSASTGATHTEDSFFAVAACGADIGYNIRFGGPRTLVRHVAGNDTTLSFGTQAFQGWRMPETSFDQSTVDYEVLGGAEMFNIKRGEDGTLDIRIHEGTLVFAALDGSHKVVARHVIRTVPGQETMVSAWQCRIVG